MTLPSDVAGPVAAKALQRSKAGIGRMGIATFFVIPSKPLGVAALAAGSDSISVEGPPDRRHRDVAIRNCRLVSPCQQEATSRRLAIHHRQSKGQIEAALPENLVWTTH